MLRTTAFRISCNVLFAALLGGCGQNASSPGALGIVPHGSGVQPDSSLTLRPAAALAACPTRAVFVRLDREIRGYPLDAVGATTPCARIVGPNTRLLERGPLVVSVNGYLHSMSFQANGFDGLTIHARNANGNVAPERLAGVDQDHVALAVDSEINDFAVASQGYEGDRCWYVVRNHQSRESSSNCDPNVAAIHALATNARDELIVAGSEVGTGRGRIDVFEQPASASPHLVRSIVGSNTRLPSIGTTLGYFDVAFSLATDPVSGSIYVYGHLYDFLNSRPIPGAAAPDILEFAPDADGNAAPRRVLAGPLVGLVDYVLGLNVLGVDDRGNLYSLSRGRSLLVSVYGRNARDNTSPERIFTDSTAAIGDLGASVAVRSTIGETTNGK